MSRSNTSAKSDITRVPKACLPCAQVKARCEIESGDVTCKRCRRLNKTCSGQAPGSHRGKSIRAHDVVRLDGASAGQATRRQLSDRVDFSLPAPTPDTLAPATWIVHFAPTDIEAEVILQLFCNDHQPLFPFIAIEAGISAMEFSEKKPFLFLVIIMVACRRDQVRQAAITRKLREIISHSILVKGEQSLDLLQCLLLYVSWYHLHLHLGSQLCNLVHLLMALTVELGLHKEPVPRGLKLGLGRLGYFGNAGSVPVVMNKTNGPAPSSYTARTLEERRTFLGGFFLTSIVSMCKRDIEPIRWSQYADECCHAILEAAEFPTDINVVHLSRLHALGHKIARNLTSDEDESTAAFNSAPVSSIVKILESELLKLKHSFSEEAHQTTFLLMHYYLVEVSLYEAAINEDFESSQNGTHPFARLSLLHACLNSTKLMFDTFQDFPLTQVFDLPYTVWTLLEHAIVVLSRLSSFKTEGWDHGHVQSRLSFAECMDKLTRKLDQATALAETNSGKIGHSSLPRAASRLFSGLKAAHQATYATQVPPSDPMSAMFATEATSIALDDGFGLPPTPSFFEFLDETFWQTFAPNPFP